MEMGVIKNQNPFPQPSTLCPKNMQGVSCCSLAKSQPIFKILLLLKRIQNLLQNPRNAVRVAALSRGNISLNCRISKNACF